MSVFQSAIESGYTTLLAVAGKQVSFRRISTDDTIADITVAVGKSEFNIDTDFGLMTKETRDFILPTASLVIESSGGVEYVTPIVGDQITEVIGTIEYTWEAYNPTGEAVFYHPDPEKKYMRIHTQLIDSD